MQLENTCTVEEAAKIVKVTPRRIGQLIDEGKIEVVWQGGERMRLLSRKSVEKYAKSDRKPGPKNAA